VRAAERQGVLSLVVVVAPSSTPTAHIHIVKMVSAFDTDTLANMQQ
jgi:hypothetical protein